MKGLTNLNLLEILSRVSSVWNKGLKSIRSISKLDALKASANFFEIINSRLHLNCIPIVADRIKGFNGFMITIEPTPVIITPSASIVR
jgi:hypothetical protein